MLLSQLTTEKNSKEPERDKYLDIDRELKRLSNMKVMGTLIVIGALRTILKILVNGLDDLEIRGLVEK